MKYRFVRWTFFCSFNILKKGNRTLVFIKIGISSLQQGERISFFSLFVLLPTARSNASIYTLYVYVYVVSYFFSFWFNVKKMADKVLLKRPSRGRCTFEGLKYAMLGKIRLCTQESTLY